MNKSKFTAEQAAALRKNKYTLSVTDYQIRFTNEFKRDFWQLYLKGTSPEEIFTQLGYDAEVLGSSRIANFAYKQVQAHMEADNLPQDQKIKKLESEVSALRCELDTLKKIIAMANSRPIKDS